MLRDPTRRTPKLVAVLASVAPSVLFLCAGTALGVSDHPTPASGTSVLSAADLLSTARQLSDSGQVIESRALLERLLRSKAGETLGDDERLAARELLKAVDGKLRSADPVEISLQKAELATHDGDLVMAERQARAVTARQSVEPASTARAEAVLRDVALRRDELRPLIPGLIDQAVQDYTSQRYTESKTAIMGVIRSGVELSDPQAQTIEKYQLSLVELERQNGRAFDLLPTTPSLGMLQPGQVRRRGEPGAPPPAPASPPAPTPAQPAPDLAAQPIDIPQHEYKPQPVLPGAATPPPASAPALTPSPEPITEPMPTQTDPNFVVPAGYTVIPPDNAMAGVQPVSAPPMTAMSAGEPVQIAMQTQPAGSDDIVRQAMRADAQRALAEADQAFANGRYNEAAEKYNAIIASMGSFLNADEVTRAQRQLDESRVRLQSNTPGRDLAQDVVKTTELQRQQARAQFDNEVTQSKARLAAGDAGRAQELAARARLTISQSKAVFNEGELDAFNKQLDELTREIETSRERIGQEEATTREKRLREESDRAERGRLLDRDRKVSESIDRIRALQAERKYGEALQVVDQVLFLDPNNPTGLLLRDVLRDIVIYQDYNDIQRDKGFGITYQTIQNQKAMKAPLGLVEFPSDWPSKSFSRGELSAFSETPENRRVIADLGSKRVPVDFVDNQFADVLKFIEAATQVNIDTQWDTLATIGITPDSPVTLKLSNATVQTVLDRVLEKAAKDPFAKAGWTVSDGILTIASDEALRKTRTLVTYSIQDLLIDIPDFKNVPQIDLSSVLSASQGGGGGQSPFTGTGDEGDNADRPTRQERIKQILDIIQQNVDFEGWRDNGGETGTVQELSGTLIITNTPKNHREIVGLLSKLREIRNMQINVETKFLLVSQSWFEQIGFDLDIVFNAGSNVVTNAQASDPTIRPSDFFGFGSQASRQGLQRQVSGQGSTVGVTTLQSTVLSQGTVPPNRLSPIGAVQNSLGLTGGLASSAVRDNSVTAQVLRSAPALGIAGQFLDDIQVDFLIQATQADRRTVQLTAPRLTFTNGQTSNIFVVTQQAFVSNLQAVTADSAVGFNPTVSVVSEGVTMLVEGVISADRRYVTMNIDAGVSRIDGFAQQGVSAVAGGQLVNSANTQSFIQLPTVTVTRIRTTSTVPDEGTLLIGGQRLITEVEVETGVPILSKIPIINRFFTNRLESREEQTLLVLLKPTILIQTEEEERSFPGLQDNLRTGLSPR